MNMHNVAAATKIRWTAEKQLFARLSDSQCCTVKGKRWVVKGQLEKQADYLLYFMEVLIYHCSCI